MTEEFKEEASFEMSQKVFLKKLDKNDNFSRLEQLWIFS
jgi:hypothetical protein